MMQKKLFVGYRLTPELKMEIAHKISSDLKTIPHLGKEYIGCYLSSEAPTIKELRQTSFHVTTILQTLCPDHCIDHCNLVVFPQLFMG